MTNNLDTLATALYAVTDDLLQESPQLAPWRLLAATLFAHESAAFDVDVPAGFDGDLLLRWRSGWVVAGVVRPAEEAGERCDGFEQQRVELGLLAGGALRMVAGYEPVPLGLGLVLMARHRPAGDRGRPGGRPGCG